MARARALVLVAALAIGAAAPTAAAAPPTTRTTYQVQDLGSLGGSSTWATGVTASGLVTGTSQTPDGRSHAFVWDPATRSMTAVADGPFDQTEGAGINERGQVVGTGSLPGGGTRAFVWDPRTGTTTALPTLGGDLAYGRGINDRGQVVGTSWTAEGEGRAFVWDPRTGTVRDLGTLGGTWSDAYAINERGQVVGDAATADGLGHAFRWDPSGGTMTDLGVLPGTVVSFGRDINDRGDVVGWAADVADESSQAFVRSARTGVLTAVPGLEHGSSEAVAINARGLVVGGLQVSGREGLAFLANPATGAVTYLPPLVAGGFARAADVADSGRVVGSSSSGTSSAVLWTPVRPRS